MVGVAEGKPGMIVFAIIATAIAVGVTVLVVVYSEGGVGYSTVFVAWIVAAILWLAVAVG